MAKTLVTAVLLVALSLLLTTCEVDASRLEHACVCTVTCPADATTFQWSSWVCADMPDTASRKARNNCEDVFTSQCGVPECRECSCTVSTRPNKQDC